jgi:hypothetical protein
MENGDEIDVVIEQVGGAMKVDAKVIKWYLSSYSFIFYPFVKKIKGEPKYIFKWSLSKRLVNLGTLFTFISLIIDIIEITRIARTLRYHGIIFISLLTLLLLHLIIWLIFISFIIFYICIIHIGIFIRLV